MWPAKPIWHFTANGLGLDEELSSKALRDRITSPRTVEGPKWETLSAGSGGG